MKLVGVEGHSGLVRDEETGAVLKINNNEAEAARERKRKRKLSQQHQEQLENEVATLRQDMDDVKNILNKILEKL